MTDINPMTDEKLTWLKNKLDKYIEEYGDDDEIQFGVAQIYPAIARIEADHKRIEKVISIAGADPGDIDGAIRMLKERKRQIGLQSNELGQLRKRIAELEAQVAGFRELATAQYAQVGKLEAEVERLRGSLKRLSSCQGFEFAGMLPDNMLADELRARMKYAEENICLHPKAEATKESEPTDGHE